MENRKKIVEISIKPMLVEKWDGRTHLLSMLYVGNVVGLLSARGVRKHNSSVIRAGKPLMLKDII